jgi:hypothetical protein
LEELVAPKPKPLVIPEIRVGAEVILIDIVTHTYEVFKTPNIILKDTHVVEKLKSQLIILAKPVDTTCEQLVDDLDVGIK